MSSKSSLLSPESPGLWGGPRGCTQESATWGSLGNYWAVLESLGGAKSAQIVPGNFLLREARGRASFPGGNHASEASFHSDGLSFQAAIFL